MNLPHLALLAFFAVGHAEPWIDLGTPDAGRGTLAVIVPQPGLRPVAYRTFAENLEARGLSTVLLKLPPTPAQLRDALFDEVLQATTGRAVLLIGHGYGGRAIVDASALHPGVCGLALLGVPLVVRTTTWPRPLPNPSENPSGLDLAQGHRSASAPTIWPLTQPHSGIEADWLGRISSPWLAHLAQATDHPLDLPDESPIWVGVAPLDELAPPETLGHLPSSTTYARWGILRGWRRDANTGDLLTDPRPASHLARWAQPRCD